MLDTYIRQVVNTLYHPVGTARMGHADDPLAAVDADGTVYGVESLAVADASIMPTSPRANTNLTCLMIAERLSDRLRS